MPHRATYPPGAPCWVDTLQPDPAAAATFYGALFGWDIDAGVARLGGERVAGVVEAPPGVPAFWITSIQVDTLEDALARVAEAGGSVLRTPTEHRTAAALDPAGIPFGLRESGGAERVGEPGAWAMSALHTPDPAAAEAFYGAVFGWEAERTPPLVRWRLGGDVVAVMTATEGEVPPHWAVNFRVADVEATLARATELGGTALLGPVEAEGLLNAVIADPQQGVFAVSATLPR